MWLLISVLIEQEKRFIGMGTYITVGIISIVVVGLVVLLSLVTLSKGYGYKHSVDPLPEEDEEITKKKIDL